MFDFVVSQARQAPTLLAHAIGRPVRWTPHQGPGGIGVCAFRGAESGVQLCCIHLDLLINNLLIRLCIQVIEPYTAQ